jgi:hypothetical protein
MKLYVKPPYNTHTLHQVTFLTSLMYCNSSFQKQTFSPCRTLNENQMFISQVTIAI